MARMPLTGFVSVQVSSFLKPFLADLPEPYHLAVKHMVLLIVGAASVMVSKLARRMVDGPSKMIHREKRLCRHAATDAFDDTAISAALRQEAALQARKDSLILLDTSDLSKPYGRKMEHLGVVHDGSGKTNGPGYWLAAAFVRLKRGRIVPMVMRCFSVVQPGIKSFNAVLVQVISQVKEVLADGCGILVCDRGFDAIRLLEPMLDNSLRFIVRLVGNRDLLFQEDGRWRKHNVRQWVDAKMAGGLRTLVATVRLPQRDEVLKLVVAPAVPGKHKQPLILLTRGVLTQRHDARWIIRAYRSRWAIEDGLRAFKQSFGVEEVRVLSLRAIQRLVLLAAVAMAFVIYLCQAAPARWKQLINSAAQHFEQRILYAFCRFAAGLHNLLTAEQLQAYFAEASHG